MGGRERVGNWEMLQLVFRIGQRLLLNVLGISLSAHPLAREAVLFFLKSLLKGCSPRENVGHDKYRDDSERRNF